METDGQGNCSRGGFHSSYCDTGICRLLWKLPADIVEWRELCHVPAPDCRPSGKPVEGDDSAADGKGKWKRGLGHAFSGKSFDLSMVQQGKKLDIVMDHKASGILRASYRCTD
jgi:hypothetical protein